jgi:hypothetical protein
MALTDESGVVGQLEDRLAAVFVLLAQFLQQFINGYLQTVETLQSDCQLC